jgi:hypothetical protein
MKLSDKIVTALPLEIIWTDETELRAGRTSYLTTNDIKNVLRESAVQFVVADIGNKLKWIDKKECFHFWKTEVEGHLANDINNIELDKFFDNYAYVASRWEGEGELPIIVLETFH